LKKKFKGMPGTRKGYLKKKAISHLLLGATRKIWFIKHPKFKIPGREDVQNVQGKAKSGYYDWLGRAPFPKKNDGKRRPISSVTENVYEDSFGSYGAPRIRWSSVKGIASQDLG